MGTISKVDGGVPAGGNTSSNLISATGKRCSFLMVISGWFRPKTTWGGDSCSGGGEPPTLFLEIMVLAIGL